jgi:NAD(P)-dependent dehydrogenase (short-subunit alcohol dehydrogenase family)
VSAHDATKAILTEQVSEQPRLALVTGASSGIGRQIAKKLAGFGYRIVVDHFRDAAGADETLRQVREAGSDGWIFDADVGSAAELDRLFAAIQESRLPLGVLVNNAAVQTFKPLIDLTEEEWNRTIRTNLTGAFLCTQRAAKLMRGGGGAIINLGSGANRVPFPGLGDYCASKGGIEMLTKVAAIELGPYQIRVNCVAPGAIENERTRRESPEYGKTWGAITPLGRVGQESDVADAVGYLVGSAASFITGQTLYVDGGLWTRGQWPYTT